MPTSIALVAQRAATARPAFRLEWALTISEIVQTIVPRLPREERVRVFNISRATRQFLFYRGGAEQVLRIAPDARSFAFLAHYALHGGGCNVRARPTVWIAALREFCAEGSGDTLRFHLELPRTHADGTSCGALGVAISVVLLRNRHFPV